MRSSLLKPIVRLVLCYVLTIPVGVSAQTAKPAWQADLNKTIELAKNEGEVVVSLTTSAELRAAIEKQFEKRFAIDVEPAVTGLLPECILQAIERAMRLPEVRDPKQRERSIGCANRPPCWRENF